MKAMIFAAGIGSRLKPLTDSLPKALVEVGGIPMLQRCILHLKSFGITDIIVNVHHLADQIVQFLADHDNFNLSIEISDERKSLLDTGGGLKKASWFFEQNSDFIAINADIITNINLDKLVNAHIKNKSVATLVVRKRHSSRCLLFNNQMRLCGWKNLVTGEEKISHEQKDAYTPYPFSGIHIINSKIFKHMGRSGKFSIVDTYLELGKTHPIFGYLDKESMWYDIGDIEKLKAAELGLSSN